MPNYCSNCLTVEGEAHVVAQFVAAMIRVNEQNHHDLDFNGVLPMPAPLANVSYGGCPMNGLYRAYGYVTEWFDVPGEGPVPIERCLLEQWAREYGATNWYDWAIENWGTKWNAGDDCQVTLEPNTVLVDFETAWSPPEGVLRAMAVRWPMLHFECESIEPGVGFKYLFSAYRGKYEEATFDWHDPEDQAWDEEDDAEPEEDLNAYDGLNSGDTSEPLGGLTIITF